MQDSFKAMAQRIVNAENGFLDYVCETTGISRDLAIKVMAYYREIRVLKIQVGVGQWTVTHGAYLDKDELLGVASLVS